MSNKENLPFNENAQSIYNFKKSNSFIKKKVLSEDANKKILLVEKQNSKGYEGSNYFSIKIYKNLMQRGINTSQLRELSILKSIKNENIIRLIDYHFFKEKSEIWMLMDYFPINLKQFFYENRENKEIMNENFFKNIAFQIISAVDYLHQNMIIHRNLKLENILYDKKKNLIKISNFKLSRKIDFNTNCKYSNIGSSSYKPPEVILGLSNYSSKYDIWSIGCLLVEICTGKVLFNADNSIDVLKIMYKLFGSLKEFKSFPLSNIIVNMPNDEGIGLINYIKKYQKFEFENNNFYDLIEKILLIDPNKRLNTNNILNYPWFLNSKNISV